MIPEFLLHDNIPCHADFLTAVDQIALRREFTSVNVRVEAFKSWRDELPRYWQLASKNNKIFDEQWGPIIRSFTP